MNLAFSMNKFTSVDKTIDNTIKENSPNETYVILPNTNIKPYNDSHNTLKNLPANENKNNTFYYRQNNFTTRQNTFSSVKNVFYDTTHKYTSHCQNCDK